MTKTLLKRGILSLFSTAFLITAVTLSAQENEPENKEKEKKSDLEIVVSASRIYEESKSVAAVVHVIDKETLEQSGSVLEALDTISEIHVVNTAPGKQYITMGGFGENGFARVLIMKDGIPLNRPDMSSFNWSSLSAENIEKIEVIRGGFSVQYGDQAVAGIINIITEKSPSPFVKARGSLDYNLSNTEAVSGSYGKDFWNFFYSFQRVDVQSVRERSDSGMYNITLAPSLDFEFFGLTSDFYFTSSECEFPGGLTKAEYEADPNNAKNKSDSGEERVYGFRISPELNIGDLTLSTPVSLNNMEQITNMASYPSFYNTNILAFNFLPQASYNFYLGDHSVLTPILGADLKYNKLDVKRYTSAERTTSQNNDATIDRFCIAPWTALNYSLYDRFFIKAGFRFEYGYTSAIYQNTAVAGGNNSVTPFSWNVNTSWIPVEGLKVFASGSRVFRYPLLDEQVVYSGWGDKFYSDIRPEFGHMVSVGAEWTTEYFGLSVVPFFSYMEDEIVYTGGRNINSDETIRFGVTADAKFESKYVDASVGYRWINATYAKGTNKDKFIPLVPQHKWKASVKGKFPLGFYALTGIVINSDFYEDSANANDKIPYSAQWDASAGWVSDWGLTVRIYCTNILGDRTPTNVYWSSFYPAEDRKFGMDISWRIALEN